jgi:hypothetical protein
VNIVLYHIHYGDFSYIDNAEKAIAAAKKAYPGATVWQIRDPQTPTFKGADRSMVLTSPVAEASLNQVRCFAYRDILSVIPENEQVIFIDTDVLIGEELDVFDWNFDVGLTWRDTLRSMPYNFGVIFARNTASARSFFAKLAEIAQGFPGGIWYVDQISLAMLMGVGYPEKRRISVYMDEAVYIVGAKIFTFPCDKYNFSPDLPPKQKLPVAHFKGQRKQWLDNYYKEFIDAAV